MTFLALLQIPKAFYLASLMLILLYESVCNKLLAIPIVVAFSMCFLRVITPPLGCSGHFSNIFTKSVYNFALTERMHGVL